MQAVSRNLSVPSRGGRTHVGSLSGTGPKLQAVTHVSCQSALGTAIKEPSYILIGQRPGSREVNNGNVLGERDEGTEAECNFPATDAPVSCSHGSRRDTAPHRKLVPAADFPTCSAAPRGRKSNTQGRHGRWGWSKTCSMQDVIKLQNSLPNLMENWPVPRPSSRS